MKIFLPFLFTALFSIRLWSQDVSGAGNRFIARNDVTWMTTGTNENDSMPLGNGDLAANVWTETNGDLLLLVAKADAWTEQGVPVKLGRVRFN